MKKLPKKTIKKRIDEFQAMRTRRGPSGDPVLETALFLEDVFGIELDDTEMQAEKLGEGADLTQLVLDKMEDR